MASGRREDIGLCGDHERRGVARPSGGRSDSRGEGGHGKKRPEPASRVALSQCRRGATTTTAEPLAKAHVVLINTLPEHVVPYVIRQQAKLLSEQGVVVLHIRSALNLLNVLCHPAGRCWCGFKVFRLIPRLSART